MKTDWPEFDQLLAEIRQRLDRMLADENADEAAIEATYTIERELKALVREGRGMTRQAIVARLAAVRLQLDRPTTRH